MQIINKNYLGALIGLLISVPVWAQESTTTDEIIVTATRSPQSIENTLADVTVIEREEIEQAGPSSLPQLLQRQPGISISTNGGPGTQSSVFLRGTNSDHVVVLVDGLRVNSATLGTFSFENMPLSQIERIEILRGPASSLYGADAIGGVIQIFTRRGGADKTNLYAAAGVGSYNTRRAEAGFSNRAGKTSFGVNVSSLDTDGFSARRIRGNSTPVDKDDDGYWNLGVSTFVEHELAEGHKLGGQFFESRGRSHFDGNNFDNYSNQTLQSFSLTSTNQITDFWLSRLTWGQGKDDSDSHEISGVSNYLTKQRQLSWQNELRLPTGLLTLAYDRLEQEVESVSPFSGFEKERNNDGFVASYQLDHQNHLLQLSVREDHNTQYGAFTTGNVGYGYRFSPGWKISAGYGSAFKAPTFNQLYFPNFGDPNLKPEESDNIEAAVRFNGQRIDFGITLFKNKIRNLIENTGPAAGNCTLGGFCPVNVGSVRIPGTTIESAWRIDDHWRLSGHFTVQAPERLNDNAKSPIDESGKTLVRRPRRSGAMNLDWASGVWKLGAELVASSERFNDVANTKRMPGYALLNLTANYAITPDWKLEARADNILDKEYELAYVGNTPSAFAYETPGANIFVGIRWQPQ